jgi:FHS family glucose/mannose:H+ symporter-like MFS transporter
MIKLAIKPLVLVFIISAFTYVLIEQSIMSWLPTFNSKVLNLPTTLSIQMASILAASTALGRFAAGIVLRKIHWFAVLMSACLPLGIGTGCHSLGTNGSGAVVTGWSNAPLGAFVFPLIGLFIAPIYPAINSVILSTLPARQHGPMSGLIVIFSALGGTTGSIITGNIFEAMVAKRLFIFRWCLLRCLLFVYSSLTDFKKNRKRLLSLVHREVIDFVVKKSDIRFLNTRICQHQN